MARTFVGTRVDLDMSKRGPDDCKKCKTRRIRCDRAMPFCKKCRSRSLQCPGYSSGIILRWDQGVASRGRLKGQDVPVHRSISSPQPASDCALPLHGQEENKAHVPSSEIASNLSSHSDHYYTLKVQLGTVTSPSPLISRTLERAPAQRLLHHYRCLVSCRLPWIDSIDNPWRSIILPLAMESPSLFFAVLSMAAEDLASQLNDASIPNAFSRDSKIYRERAMRLLTGEFANELTTDSVRPLNSQSITSALAATLVLCNLEIKQLHSTSWQVHLRAARAVIHRCTVVDRLPSSTSVMNAFLIHKFFSINVFASMSTFSDTHDLLSDTLGDECNSVFLEFLRIMQQITYDQRHPREFPYHRIPNCDELRGRLIRARTTTLLSNEALMVNSETARRDLENIVDMFYYAGLIYGHRALLFQCCFNDLQKWRDKTLEQLHSLNELDKFCQDLLWPLFIAGTESRPGEAAQEFLVKKIHQIVKLSGHWNGLGALKFLGKLWESSNDGSITWIELARDWARQGNDFIVI